jgi:DNA polymerase bacteriophage-type
VTPYKRIVTCDFETFYSTTYSLRSANLSTSSYIRHPEFHAHCVGIKVDDDPTHWYPSTRIEDALQAIDWSTSAFLAHHAAFDGLILSHHFGIVPSYYLDTLSMARALHSNAIGAGLDEVAGFYRLGHKAPDVLAKLKGVRNPGDALLDILGEYCAKDVDLCRGIFDRMIDRFTQDELDLIDITVRMFASPILQLDLPRLKTELVREQEEKARKIAASGVSLTVLSSTEKFAHELTCSGVEAPPQKKSKTTGQLIYAFSKTDQDFLDLRGHPSERVRNLVAGRLAAKSTLAESRAKRLIDSGRNGYSLPVYLNYYGAHTGRWSAGDKVNLQNLPRAQYDKEGTYLHPSAELRRSICAPPGHVLIVADSAQIEARILAWLAEDREQLKLFEHRADVYKHMAMKIFHTEVANVTKDQRFIGKVATLGLGYGMGVDKFRLTMALGMLGEPIFLSKDQCWHIVQTYRNARMAVTQLWRRLEAILHSMVQKRDGKFSCLEWSGDNKRVYLPNGMYLQYPYLERQLEGGFQFFDYKSIVRKKFMGTMTEPEGGKLIHGGLFTENVVQALARIVIGEQMLAIARYLCEVGDGFYRRIVTMTHDEIVVCVPKEEAEGVFQHMLQVMRTSPGWATELPLDAEGGYAENYSK